MLEYINSNLIRLSAHRVENKVNGGEVSLSADELDISDNTLREEVLKYVVNGFKTEEQFRFTFTNDEVELNPIYQYVSRIFDSNNEFHEQSKNLAKHLYNCSNHPNIKNGDLYIAFLEKVELEGKAYDAIGIFKAENKTSFLKLDSSLNNYTLRLEKGTSTNKLDKGCIILNSNRDNGFRVLAVDQSNRGEAQYWFEDFLNITSIENEFHSTTQYLNLARSFITEKLPSEVELERADQIDLLNRSVEYFKSNEQFEEEHFANEVFANNDVISSFKNYKDYYEHENEVKCIDDFEISNHAVKKQSRIFKSVLKLDKNFHLYIHGNRSLIEKGYDESKGKNFYKIYFDEEN